MEKDSGTRSGMLWEVERILDEIVADGRELPQVLLMENVPEVIGQKNIGSFAKWVEKLDSLGYKNKWEVLNAKEFGIPQNRERCFMVSILGDYYYDFPKTMPLKLKLKDLLEKEVDEKFYLSDRALNGVLNTTFNCSKLESRLPKDGVSPTICARDYKDPKLIVEESDIESNDINLKRQLCNKLIQNNMVKEGDIIRHSYSNNRLQNGDKNMGRVESKEQLSPTLDTRCDCLGIVVRDEPIGCELRCDEGIRTFEGNVMGTLRTIDACGGKHIIESQNKRLKSLVEKTEFGEESLALDCFNQVAHQEFMHTIKTNVDKSNMNMVYNNLRIRKLVPIECFRLMSVKDEDFRKIEKNQSNASLFHLAGDSLVTTIIMALVGKMLDIDWETKINNFEGWWHR